MTKNKVRLKKVNSFAMCSDTFFSKLIFDFAECENGKYGLHCENNCNHCQQDTQCHNVNGSCLQGCSPGYTGPFCNICKLFNMISIFVNSKCISMQ